MPAPLNITGSARFRKTRKRVQVPLLPGDMAILRQADRERKKQRESSEPQQQLEYLGPLRNFTPMDRPLKRNEMPGAAIVVHKLLEHVWLPFPEDENGRHTIHHRTVAETAEVRRRMPRLVPMSQLYGVFPSATTKVDQEVSRAVANGALRLLTTNLPDNMDLLIDAADFYAECEAENAAFAAICRENPQATWFDAADLRRQGVDVDAAIEQGYLAVDPGRPGIRTVTFPGQGMLLKHVAQARAWLLKTMVQSNRKFREMLESQMREKLVAHKGYWTQLRGVTLEWILYDAVGGGWIDGFETPVGRGWKVLKS